MFGFGNKKKKLEKEYAKKLEESVKAQRNGDIALYSELASQADELLKKIELLESEES